MRSRPNLPWLHGEHPEFPDPRTAWRAPDGLLAAGGALTVPWLLKAYRCGIFPWFDDDQGPILWWSPDPRAGLIPGSMHVSRSLRKTARSWVRDGRARASVDAAFAQVLTGCAAPRKESAGTWITPNMQSAYLNLHCAGHAHSVEIWRDGALIGGIYGVAVGRIFCGESMFSADTGGSKIAFFVLSELLQRKRFVFLDAQMPTRHLATLGVQRLSRDDYLQLLSAHAQFQSPPGPWALDADLAALEPLLAYSGAAMERHRA